MSHHSRREMLKLLGTMPLVAAAARPAPAVAQGAAPKTRLCLVSRHLQWANVEEAVTVAAEAGCKAIAWTIRPGAHILAENVEKDLPKAVDLAHKAGLDTPMVITAIVEATSTRAEAILATMHGVGIRYYRAPSFRYDYNRELEPQLEALKPRIGSLADLNAKYGTTAMYHTHSASGNVGGGVWDLWLALKNFDRELVGLNYDLGHATIRGGSGWMETSHFAHRYVHGLSVKDFRWVKRSVQPGDAAGGGRRGTGAWSPEMVPGGEGMVDFSGMLSYFKSVGFAGPVELYQEYTATVPGVAQPVNMLGTDLGKWKLEMSKAQYISLLKRDVDFYTKQLADAGLV
jgi:L-ribulose-5-phosphate 3-epimerase